MSDDLRRQLWHQLEGLRSAGVQFVGKIHDLPPIPAVRAQASEQPLKAVSQAVPQIAAVQQPEPRRLELRLLADRVSKCSRCPELASTRTQTVFGVGPLDPELCFLGEAPGADEDRQGQPFVGAAGQLLDRIIVAMGMKREEVYICNILRCRPPANRQPKPDESKNCREYLDAQLDLVRPRFICTLGATAAQNLLGTTIGVGKLRGTFRDYRGIPVLCTYHPASLLPSRSPEKKKDVWEDMKLLLAKMGKPIPVVGKKAEG
ncbi:MAG: uracil-DNA glycosylase [Planctomycetes bacterium]|nr:uracil-DNA glycosylase [Planctomycetota bacterium]